MRTVRRLLLVLITLGLSAAKLESQTGLLVVAHGATTRWNDGVRQVVAQVRWDGPIAVAFLMGDEGESTGWNAAVTGLVRAGAKDIVVVPLLVSSHGGHYREIRSYAGEVPEAAGGRGDHGHGAPALHPVPMRVTDALDAAPELGEALRERWRALSPADRHRPLVLVAHGPESDEEARLWISNLEESTAVIGLEGGIPIGIGLLRDDAPAEIRAAAVKRTRELIDSLGRSRNDSVTVLPVLISAGSIGTVTIPADLGGLPIRYTPAPLAPLPQLAVWIERVALAKRAATQ
jgi:sirohydrochlorin ferrochelatase